MAERLGDLDELYLTDRERAHDGAGINCEIELLQQVARFAFHAAEVDASEAADRFAAKKDVLGD